MLTLAYVPIISCQGKPPDRSELHRYIKCFLSPRDIFVIFVSSEIRACQEGEKIPSGEIVSVATNRRCLITRKREGTWECSNRKRKRTGDDEANASDVVSRDRRPSSSATKAQHREATHKYIYICIYIRLGALRVDATIIFSPLIAGNRGRSLRFRFPSLPPLSLLRPPPRPLLLPLRSFFFTQRTTPRVIHCDGMPLPLVFRSSLNKQAPIKVPGVYSTSGSRDHQSRRICEAL